jgi:YidC/Oxa1 family membrane protein insertase
VASAPVEDETDAWRREADTVRESDATTVSTSACEIEVAHGTASVRAWRLKGYRTRDAKGRLKDEPVDLVPVFSRDYAGLRWGADALEWTPVGSVPSRIVLSAPSQTATLAFRAERNGVEVTKAFRFHGAPSPENMAGNSTGWKAYAVDVEVTFRNAGEARTDAAASGYEFRWGPGIAADGEGYHPGDFGARGGLQTSGALSDFASVRDFDRSEPGPQKKDGGFADGKENQRTVWAALHSKYFVAALLSSELESDPGMARVARFSEYEAFPISGWPKEDRRLHLILDIGKGWLQDDDHLAQRRSERYLIFPAGTTTVSRKIADTLRRPADDPKQQAKVEDQQRSIYAEFAGVTDLLTGTRLEVPGFFLDAGASRTDRFRLYAGPKHTELLRRAALPGGEAPAHLHEIVQYGGVFGGLAKAMLWLLKRFYAVVRNYGVAIILLTILVRLALYPITQRSSESTKRMMTRMKIIQPELEAVKQKYRHDSQRAAVEMQKVYQKYGINPAAQLGGCLLMLAQMPVFIAMYQMLAMAGELRGEPFLLWVDDLTAPDLLVALAGFPVRVLPLLMLGGMLLQQAMSPSGATAGLQKTLTYLMPAMFVFLFYGMPAGLNLYWGVSTLLGVGQQYLVNKYGKSTGEENLTAADLERMAKQEQKRKRRRSSAGR